MRYWLEETLKLEGYTPVYPVFGCTSCWRRLSN